MYMGFLNVNKPSGPTSHDIVDAIRRITGVRTVGHAGTLDPFASGVLIFGIGRDATKRLDAFKELRKTYRATLRLGATSDTYDRTGHIVNSKFKVQSSKLEIKRVLKKFEGEIEQIPPMYSAKKVGGKKLYELAREGKIIERKPIKITIYSIRLIHVILDQESSNNEIRSVIIEVTCSPGTYIRALAHDIGKQLGCSAYCEDLIRTAIGPYQLDDAVKVEHLASENWQSHLINPPAPLIKVLVFGTFDHLHPGHLDFFQQAKALGTHLIVGIGRDKVVQRIKGKLPRHDETSRKKAVEDYALANEVLLLSENPGERFSWIKKISPDIIALGYDQAAFTETLSDDLLRHGIHCVIKRLKPFHPEIYKSSKIP